MIDLEKPNLSKPTVEELAEYVYRVVENIEAILNSMLEENEND